MDEIRHAIQSSNINFLFGSGISMPFLKTLGDVEQRLTELRVSSLNDQEKILISTSIKQIYFEACIKPNTKLISGDISASAVLKAYEAWLDSLNTILLNRKNTLLGKQINLFTSNMDLFTEMALENLSLEFNDGFYGTLRPTFGLSNFRKSVVKTSQHHGITSELPLFNLFKIHGSLSWHEVSNAIELDNTLEHIDEINSVSIPVGSLLDILDKTGSIKSISDLAKEAKGKTIDPSLDEFNSKYDKLTIVNPTKEKFETTLMNATYYELLRIYANELERENSILFVQGFSFADEHLSEITKRVANSNPTLKIVIFAYDSVAEDQIRNNLDLVKSPPRFSNISFQKREIIYDTSGKPTGETPFTLDQISKVIFSSLAKDVSGGSK